MLLGPCPSHLGPPQRSSADNPLNVKAFCSLSDGILWPLSCTVPTLKAGWGFWGVSTQKDSQPGQDGSYWLNPAATSAFSGLVLKCFPYIFSEGSSGIKPQLPAAGNDLLTNYCLVLLLLPASRIIFQITTCSQSLPQGCFSEEHKSRQGIINVCASQGSCKN